MTMWSEMDTDAQLIGWAVAGDGEAFAHLIDRHQRSIYAYLARRAGAPDAKDLLADVWVAAFRGRTSFDSRWESARPWLFGIARNSLRTRWGRRNEVSLGKEEASEPWPETDDRLSAAATVGKLSGAVNALPPVQREVLLLVAWEDLTPAEIAVVLGILPGTVRSHLHRARRSLLDTARALSEVETPLYCKET
jgi:RNA polymerase sigma-70 factor (ECF subfamily)